MSHAGKSAAAAFVVIGLVYGLYFTWALTLDHVSPNIFVHMLGAVLGLAIALAAVEIAIAFWEIYRGGADVKDERDARNGAKSARNAYYVLVSMVWAAPFIVLAQPPVQLSANALLAMLVIAEMAHFGSRAFYDLHGV